MARLPRPGSDDNQWGDILNDYLQVEHNADGSQKLLSQSKVTNLASDLAGKEDKSAKGAANGYAGLGSTSKVPAVNLGGAGADATKFLRGDQTWTAPTDASAIHKDDLVFNVKDYGALGDGTTDDRTAIAATLTAAAAVKGITFFPASSAAYMVDTATPLAIPSNITVMGYGATVKRKAGSGTLFGNSLAASAISIKGLAFDNANSIADICGFGNGSAKCRFESLTFTNFVTGASSALSISFPSGGSQLSNENITIQNCQFYGTAGLSNQVSIIVNNPKSLHVNDCYFEDSGGIKCETSSGFSGNARRLQVSNNRFIRVEATAILVRPNGNTIIEDIIVANNSAEQIGITNPHKGLVTLEHVGAGTTGTVKRAVIIGNTLKYFGGIGISVGGGSGTGKGEDIAIIGNQIDGSDLNNAFVTGSTAFGITVINTTGFSIADNAVRLTGGPGVRVVTSDHGTVRGNSAINCLQGSGLSPAEDQEGGIALWSGCSNVTISANIVKNSGIDITNNPNSSAITASASSTNAHIVVTGNRCYDDRATKHQAYGVRIGLQNTDANQPQNWTVNNNDLSGNATDGLKTYNTTDKGHSFFSNQGSARLQAIGRVAPADDALAVPGRLEIGAASVHVRAGTGTPEAVVTAPVGSLYQRSDGGAYTSLYVKTAGAGNTGWSALPQSIAASNSLDRTNNEPGIIAPYATHAGAAVTGALSTANRAYLGRFVPSRDMTITLIAFAVSTAATVAGDTCDVGIYDAAANRLVSAGSTSGKLDAVGVKIIALSATNLVAGTTYYAAFSYGAIGGTAAILVGATMANFAAWNLFGAAAGQTEAFIAATSHPLPPTVISAGSISITPLLAVRES